MKTAALYGGSFDPPHIGHEAVVKALIDLDFLDEIILMPTYLNPFKAASCAPAKLRLGWLENIFSNYKKVRVSSFEVDMNKKVPTLKSVQHLLKNYEKIYLVIGADNLKSLQEWYKYEELNKLVTFIVASRENIDIPKEFIKINIDIDISSSELRKKIDISKLAKQNSQEIATYYTETMKEKNAR
ncbi:nicotinate (nicotinamide) nucleotide adenylyltransferase [Sulfurimonas aquatica]|uniref:Probable nicotinate-nucleotide adenylyltransferase n=1 Tax=Sulfurimonas aquatica TaxID=2672570 RepID=A0A975B1Z7_9BACT|nr:nicotinate (nicotinamide) nucleotide adenylyltransferase [Sulfurimonas aquatica]QSZ42645.1 nicotinate (nicotinamide) nucleotide adenylyltransferase [Sulfurimonas aquatica]